MKNKILLVLLFFVLISPVNALEFCDMSDEYKRYLELSEEEQREVNVPDFCASSYTVKSSIIMNNEISADKASVSQSRYNAVDDGIITPVKNQMNTGSCWAFQANSLFETAVIKNGFGVYDFSERHMEYASTYAPFISGVNPLGFNRELDTGGHSQMYTSYYYRGAGPILESSMPFENNSNLIEASSMPDEKAQFLLNDYQVHTSGEVCSNDEINYIKSQIVKYGSVGIGIFSDAKYTNGAYIYNYEEENTDHAVTLVGWDDSISSSNFKGSPSKNGAFIMKNSWGTNAGDHGYYYVSYSDRTLCSRIVSFDGVVKNNYDSIYQSSPAMSNAKLSYNSSTFYSAVKIEKTKNNVEYIDRVTFEIEKGNNYELLYTTSSLNDKSSWISLNTFTASFSGAKTIYLNNISFTKDTYFILKATGSIVDGPVACRTKMTGDYSHYSVPVGVNFISSSGKTFYDISGQNDSYFDGCMNVFYVYTKNLNSNATFDVEKIEGSSEKVYSNSNDFYTLTIKTSNIDDYSLFSYKILDENGKDYTTYFNIEGSVESGSLILKQISGKVLPMGTYKFYLTYAFDTKSYSFDIYSKITSSTYQVIGNIILARINDEIILSKEKFISNLVGAENYILYNKVNEDVTNSTKYVGTGFRIEVDGSSFDVAVIGDINGDGKVQSNDALLIQRKLVSLINFNNIQNIAADVSGDGKVLSNDALIISRYLVGLRERL